MNFRIAKGKLEIDSQENRISYTLENTRLELSEPGETIEEGNIEIRTEEYGNRYNIMLTIDYDSRLEMTFDDEEQAKILHAGTAPHKIQIENVGDNAPDEKTHIDFNIL